MTPAELAAKGLRIDALKTLYEAVKAGDFDRAVLVSRNLTSKAHDTGEHEPLSPMVVEKIMLRNDMNAALALHNAVLPDVPWNIWRSGDEYGCNITGALDTEYAPDPARALLLADLAAMIEQEGEG